MVGLSLVFITSHVAFMIKRSKAPHDLNLHFSVFTFSQSHLLAISCNHNSCAFICFLITKGSAVVVSSTPFAFQKEIYNFLSFFFINNDIVPILSLLPTTNLSKLRKPLTYNCSKLK